MLADDVDRAALKSRLRERHGVRLAGEVYDLLLADQPYFAKAFEGRAFPAARRFADHHICLPLYPDMTAAEQDRVIAALRQALS
jgi:dTDP-4-amino-4,6-dideoxygalactose transaminase